MKVVNFAIGLVGAIILLSCQQNDDIPPRASAYLINGSVQSNSLSYKQTVFDGGSNDNINVFNRTDKTLYLQSFKNGVDDNDGFWTIRMNGIDIENLTLPYSLTGAEGSITWVDESIKKLQAPCASSDVLCFYSGVGVDEVEITINNIENDIITGEFKGTLNHIRVNPSVIRDTDDFVEVSNGKFSIKFQSK